VSDGGVKNRTMKRRRTWWMVTAREARSHAILLAVTTWLVSLVITFGGSGRMSLVGVMNAPDFVHFYTFGRLSKEHRIRDAYDWEKFHAEQISIVPESANLIYPPVYPPQAAVLFIPFSKLSFGAAAAVWTLVTVIGYGFVVWRAWHTVREWLPDRVLVFAAAAGSPPFWSTVMNGQVTIVVLVACFCGWIALEYNQRFWAGAALGLLAMKPQFGVPFAAIVLARRDWQMALGAVVSITAQAFVVWWVLGPDAFAGYAAMLPTIAAHADELEAKPFQSHSIRALTRLLPEWIGAPLWIATSGMVLWKTAKAWTTDVPLTVRFGLVILAAVLVNPHLIVYDAAILVLPLIWFGAWLIQQRTANDNPHASTLSVEAYGALLYGLVLVFIAPTAAVVGIQISVLLLLWLFWKIQAIAQTARPVR
jgi:alpha-1,2-mannosyltransferase